MVRHVWKPSHSIPHTRKRGYRAPKRIFISISSKVMWFIVSNSVKFSKNGRHFEFCERALGFWPHKLFFCSNHLIIVHYEGFCMSRCTFYENLSFSPLYYIPGVSFRWSNTFLRKKSTIFNRFSHPDTFWKLELLPEQLFFTECNYLSRCRNASGVNMSLTFV